MLIMFVEADIANRALSFQRSAEFQIILQLLKRIYYFLSSWYALPIDLI
jgi:hypothetical protein